MFLPSLSFFLGKHGICRHKCKFSEVFADAKVKLLCSEVRANARVKLSLPTLPKAKLHYPQDNFTYEVNFTCPLGKLSFSVFSVKDNTLNRFDLFYVKAYP